MDTRRPHTASDFDLDLTIAEPTTAELSAPLQANLGVVTLSTLGSMSCLATAGCLGTGTFATFGTFAACANPD